MALGGVTNAAGVTATPGGGGASVQNNLNPSTTVAPSATAVNTGLNSVKPTSTTFTQTIKLDKQYSVATVYTQTGDLAFTFDSTGAVLWGSYNVTVLANGSNIDFTGFTKYGAQDLDITNGQENGITFWYEFGRPNYSVALGGFVTPPTAPETMVAPVATGGDTTASVAFTAPANGGSAITGYTITSSPGSFTGTGTVSPIVVTGLTNGVDYTFTATATNAVGTSSASPSSNTITPVGAGFSDNFTRADAATLGANWTVYNDTAKIISNKAAFNGGINNALAVAETGLANGTLTCTVSQGLFASTCGLCFRFVDSSNYMQVRVVGGAISLRTVIAGTATNVGTSAGQPSMTNGNTYVMSVVLSGSSIIIKVDGVTYWTATASNFSTATKCGLYSDFSNNNSSFWDNFSMVP